MLTLDQALLRLALKRKDFVVLDLRFPTSRFLEFRSAYEKQYIPLSGYAELALGMAAGLASQGYLVLIDGGKPQDAPDPTLNIKWIQEGDVADWRSFEQELEHFGPGVLLIPPADCSTL